MATNFQLNVKAIVDSVDLQEQIKKIKIDPIKIQIDVGGAGGKGGVSGIAGGIQSATQATDKYISSLNNLILAKKKYIDGVNVSSTYKSESDLLDKTVVITNKATIETLNYESAQKRKTQAAKEYATYLEKQAIDEQRLSNQEAILRKQFDDKVASNAAGIQTLKVRMTGLTDEQLRLVNASERLNEIQSMTNVDQQAKSIRALTADINAASRGTNTFAATLQYMTERFVQIGMYVAIFRKLKNAISDMVETVSSLDSSLVELRKVTDMTDSQLESFTKTAFEVGDTVARTGQEVVDATTVFSRAGYELQDALDLGKSALLLTNTADGITEVADASSTLISVLKAFNMEAEESSHIVDALNEVSNNYAIDTDNLADILQRASGTLGQTGTTMEEVFGLAVGGFTTLRNAEMVASGLNMISQRMRGMKEDGEEIEGLVPKIESALQKYTNGAVTMWDKQTGELRSTYDVLNDLASVYPSLTSAQKAYLNEVIAGDNTTLYVQKCA